MTLLFKLALSIVLAGLIHEASHYLTARYFGHKLVFRRLGFRFVWDMPSDTPEHQRVIALAGFGAEIGASLAVGWFLPFYPVVAVTHLVAYRFYAGEYSDFKWL